VGQALQDDLHNYHRTGVRKSFFDVGIRFRPPALQRPGLREMHPHMVWDFYTTLGGRLIAERLHTGYTFFLRNGGFLKLSWNRNLQGITAPFEISPRVDCIPPGRYSW